MKPLFREPLAWLTVILLSLSIFSFIIWLSPDEHEGTIDIMWSSPNGKVLNDLHKGDRIYLGYVADTNLSVYFLTREQASEYRRPYLYKEELPEPLVTGIEGECEIEVKEDGDYEILFWNENFSTYHRVEYEYEYESHRENFLSIVSTIILLFLAIMIFTIVLRKRHGPDTG